MRSPAEPSPRMRDAAREKLVAKLFMSEASPVEKILDAQKNVNLRQTEGLCLLRQLHLADVIAFALQRAD